MTIYRGDFVEDLERYREFILELDYVVLTVYLCGLSVDDEWIEFATFDDVNDPDEFAQGAAEMIRLMTGKTVQVIDID